MSCNPAPQVVCYPVSMAMHCRSMTFSDLNVEHMKRKQSNKPQFFLRASAHL